MAAPDDITGPVNLGNPVETSVAELAELIIALTGSRSEIVYRPLPVDDPVQRCPDITQAQAVLGWQPRTALKDGLTRTIAYFDQLLIGARAGRPAQSGAGRRRRRRHAGQIIRRDRNSSIIWARGLLGVCRSSLPATPGLSGIS